jgi:hypothetical protein
MSRNMILKPLKKLSPKFKRKEFIGFDIETRYNNKVFLLATMSFADGSSKTFTTKESFIEEMMLQKYKNKIFCASFMEFDAMGIFRGTKYEGKITPMMREAFIFMAKTYVQDGELVRIPDRNKYHWPVQMVDTMAYAPMGVEALGRLVNHPKMKHPKCFNRQPETLIEWEELEKYCVNDSEISRKAMEFFHDSFIKVGIKPKLTIASCAMDDFKRNHLDMPLRRMSEKDIEFAFESYFGAMNGVFKRGVFDGRKTGQRLYYHDVNNMYGSQMVIAVLPHPNYMRRCYKDDQSYIMNYEGCSDVDIISPSNQKYPLLPFRDKGLNKIVYCVGNWRGTYTHIELRKALEIGYKITKVYSSLYSTATMKPFEYVKNDYEIRKKLKAEDNPLNEMYKLKINAIYGKFGEKGKKNRKWVFIDDVTMDEIVNSQLPERVGDYFIIDMPIEEPKAHCNPLWAGYISAMARLKLWDLIIKHNPYYVDTDSIICDHFIEDSNELGFLKMEMEIERAIFIRSKFYLCLPVGYEHMDKINLMKQAKIKIKGVPKNMLIDEDDIISDDSLDKDDIARYKDKILDPETFEKIIRNHKVRYKKFMRYRESIRRGKKQNEAIIQEKNFDLEDTKRFWLHPLSFDRCDDSLPLQLIGGIIQENTINEGVIYVKTY